MNGQITRSAGIVQGMKRAAVLESIARAERDVARGQKLLSRQKRIVQGLERGGHDARVGRELLLHLEGSQALHVAELARLQALLACAQ
jgi:hypothetical protein